jgi:hypothetical protein
LSATFDLLQTGSIASLPAARKRIFLIAPINSGDAADLLERYLPNPFVPAKAGTQTPK